MSPLSLRQNTVTLLDRTITYCACVINTHCVQRFEGGNKKDNHSLIMIVKVILYILALRRHSQEESSLTPAVKWCEGEKMPVRGFSCSSVSQRASLKDFGLKKMKTINIVAFDSFFLCRHMLCTTFVLCAVSAAIP